MVGTPECNYVSNDIARVAAGGIMPTADYMVQYYAIAVSLKTFYLRFDQPGYL